MRVLFDESMPRPFARDIIGHEVLTVRRMRWTGTANGELLRRAAAAGFKAIVTMDRNMQYQQNVSNLELGIVVVRAPSNALDDLRPLARDIVAALNHLDQGQVVHVGNPPQQRHWPGGRRTEPR